MQRLRSGIEGSGVMENETEKMKIQNKARICMPGFKGL